MSDKPQITQKQIQSRATSQSFSRGKTLHNNASISHTVRRGDEIEARCRGSYPEPYRVWAHFSGSEIISVGCNCEYDWGGDCKHIVALLLTYLHEPDRFEERQTLQSALMSRNKEDLVDIIMLMVTRYPDLQDIVDHPTPNEIATGVVPLDTLNFRKQLRDAFGSYDYDDYYSHDYASPARSMNQVSSVADNLAQRGDWLNAAAVYRTVLEEFSEMDDGFFDPHDDGIFSSLYNITSALERCLAQSVVKDNDEERLAILNALLGVFIWDMKMGGYGLSDDVPELILQYIQREDIVPIRKRIEQARDGLKRDWGAETYQAFLIDLDMLDDVDPEVILANLNAQGMDHLLTAKLLELGRLDESLEVIRENMHDPHEHRRALDLLIKYGHQTSALPLSEEILAKSYDYRLADWLIGQYKASDNKEGSLRWQKRQMQERPNIQDYGELKTTAQALNQWEDLRPQIIRDLQAGENYELLTHIYLHDEEWNLAWETLPAAEQQHRSSIYQPKLDIIVAEASRHVMPERALPIYIKYARHYIERRGRSNYQTTADLLKIVQELYDQLGEIETWEKLIANIRAEFKQLPALQDELKKAGL